MSAFGVFKSCFLVFLFSIGAVSNALSEQAVIQTIGQEPYSYIAKNGEIEGYHFLIANRILETAGFNNQAEPQPLKRIIRNLKEGASDCILAAKSPFAQAHFTPVADLGHDLKVGILPRAGLDLNSYEDLKPLRIGVPAGMSIGKPFDTDTSLTKIATPDYVKSSLMLKAGRIDAIMGALESIRFSAYKAQNDIPLTFGKPLITQSYPVALLCNNEKAESEIVLKLKAAALKLRESGEITKIVEDFFAEIDSSS